MAFTYSKLAEVTVATSASSIDFTNIPQNYTDLVLKVSARNDTNEDTLSINFNSTTGLMSSRTLYTYVGAPTAGTAASGSTSAQNATEIGGTVISTYTSNTFSNVEIYIPNYTSANNKSFSADTVNENNATQSRMQFTAGLYSNAATINKITLTTKSAQSFVQYSTATLYGVKAEV